MADGNLVVSWVLKGWYVTDGDLAGSGYCVWLPQVPLPNRGPVWPKGDSSEKKKSSWLNKPEDPSSNPSFCVKASQCSMGVCNPRVPMKEQRRATLYKLTATEQILGLGIFFELRVCRGRHALHHMLTCIRTHTYVPKN